MLRAIAVSLLYLTSVWMVTSAEAAPEIDTIAPSRNFEKQVQLATKRIPPRAQDETSPAAPVGVPDAKPVPQATLPSSFDPPKRTLADCLKLWDKDTHMTKAEWKATCIRSMQEAEKHEREVKAEQLKREREKARKGVN